VIRLSQLIGQRAIALGDASTTGAVKGVAIDGDRIVAVEISGGGMISAGAVRSFEGDVLTYDEQATSSGADIAALDPRGMRVLDMSGDGRGTIDDLAISATGTIESLLLSTGEAVPGTRLRAIGSYAAVLTGDLPPPTGAPVAGP